MKTVFQREGFDCFAACVASITELPLADMPTFDTADLVKFRESLPQMPLAEKEEKILQFWAETMPRRGAEFSAVWDSWAERHGLWFLRLAADFKAPGYSILVSEYRASSHTVVLLDGNLVHNPATDLRPHWMNDAMRPAGVIVIVPLNPACAVRDTSSIYKPDSQF